MHCYEIAEIDRSLAVDAFESQQQDLELYTQINWQPVKFKEHGSQMIIYMYMDDVCLFYSVRESSEIKEGLLLRVHV